MSEAIEVLKQLPEFDRLQDISYYSQRISGVKHQILICDSQGELVGCKLGYDRFSDGSFYSWLGGVLPNFRKKGIARKLSQVQEKWAKQEGYKSIKFKTLNRHKAMLHFALENGFNIYSVKPKDDIENYRIELVKHL